MRVRDSSLASRVKGFLGRRSILALCAALLVVVALAHQFRQSRSDNRLDTRGRTLPDFIEQLQKREVQLKVIPTAEHGAPSASAYLTEDAAATWESMQYKLRIVERIGQWHGTVWVGYASRHIGAEDEFAQWGEYGCRIGDFILFGDKRLLERIREACR